MRNEYLETVEIYMDDYDMTLEAAQSQALEDLKAAEGIEPQELAEMLVGSGIKEGF